jgi:uncharacterized protein YyaL (SSP411 family)
MMFRRVYGASRALLLAAMFGSLAASYAGAGAAAAAVTPSSRNASEPSSPRGSSPQVPWRDWSREAFDDARATNRLVLLNITTTWCHSCRVMAESTYTDPLVVAEINASYVPILADHDLRPDVGDRYLAGGWPTTAVLSPEGHLLASTTFLPASGLREFLAQATRFYRMNRSQVDRKVEEAERSVAHTWDPDTLDAPTMSGDEYIQMNLDALQDLEDKTNGGFGSAPKTPRWDAISFLLRAADARRDDRLRALAVRAATAALALQDSVDGGFFRAALEPDWSRPRYERLLVDQARGVSVLGRVWRATGDHRFRDAADRAVGYVGSVLAGPPRPHGDNMTRTPWRASSGPDIVQKDGSWLNGEIYFRLSSKARRGQSSPPVSSAVLTDAAAAFASSSLRWNRWSGTESPARPRDVLGVITDTRALVEILTDLWNTMSVGDGSFYHASADGGRYAPGLLVDQAAMGNACLDAYEATRNTRWLARADSVAAWTRAHLEDPIGGGLRYAPRDTSGVGRLKAGDKPEAANVEAAAFFLRLFWLTGNDAHRLVAQRISDHLRSGPVLTLDPARADLVLLLATEPVRLAVVGDGPKAFSLWQAARGALAPEVVVRNMAGPPRSDGRPPACERFGKLVR